MSLATGTLALGAGQFFKKNRPGRIIGKSYGPALVDNLRVEETNRSVVVGSDQCLSLLSNSRSRPT